MIILTNDANKSLPDYNNFTFLQLADATLYVSPTPSQIHTITKKANSGLNNKNHTKTRTHDNSNITMATQYPPYYYLLHKNNHWADQKVGLNRQELFQARKNKTTQKAQQIAQTFKNTGMPVSYFFNHFREHLSVGLSFHKLRDIFEEAKRIGFPINALFSDYSLPIDLIDDFKITPNLSTNVEQSLFKNCRDCAHIDSYIEYIFSTNNSTLIYSSGNFLTLNEYFFDHFKLPIAREYLIAFLSNHYIERKDILKKYHQPTDIEYYIRVLMNSRNEADQQLGQLGESVVTDNIVNYINVMNSRGAKAIYFTNLLEILLIHFNLTPKQRYTALLDISNMSFKRSVDQSWFIEFINIHGQYFSLQEAITLYDNLSLPTDNQIMLATFKRTQALGYSTMSEKWNEELQNFDQTKHIMLSTGDSIELAKFIKRDLRAIYRSNSYQNIDVYFYNLQTKVTEAAFTDLINGDINWPIALHILGEGAKGTLKTNSLISSLNTKNITHNLDGIDTKHWLIIQNKKNYINSKSNFLLELYPKLLPQEKALARNSVWAAVLADSNFDPSPYFLWMDELPERQKNKFYNSLKNK